MTRTKSFHGKVEKKILIITPGFRPNLGGVETHLDDLCEYLRTRNYFVYVLTYQPLITPVRGKGVEKKRNLEIHRFGWFGHSLFNKFAEYPPIFNFLYLTPYLFLRTFLFMLTHRKEIDIVHAIGLSSSFIARFMKVCFGKSIIMSTENLYYFKQGSVFAKVARWVWGGFDRILAHSDASRDELVGIGVPKEKITVFTHWVNQNRFKPGDKKELKKKLGWQDKFTVLFVGRLASEKGIGVVLDLVKKCQKDIAFKIIGDDGLLLPEVKEAEARLDNLEYVGRVPYDKLPPYYGAADVFLYPALYEEDVSRALLEALSCGTPVINTNKGSGIYALKPSVSFVTSASVDEIQEKIELLYEDPKLLRKMTKNAPVFAKKFGPDLAKIITQAYKELERSFLP